jgi:hypothetical protein
MAAGDGRSRPANVYGPATACGFGRVGSHTLTVSLIVSGPLDGDAFTLIDTPEIGVPECTAACETVTLDLKVGIESGRLASATSRGDADYLNTTVRPAAAACAFV